MTGVGPPLENGSMADAEQVSVLRHVRYALGPEPARARVAAGVAVLGYVIVVYLSIRAALVAAGHPPDGLTHAVLPALFGGMFAFLGSLGGSLRSGVVRAGALSLIALPVTLLAIVVRDLPVASGLTLALAAAGAGFLAWHGEPFATLGSLLLYMFFVPLAFGAGRGVSLRFLLISFATMALCTVLLRALVAAVPRRHEPPRVAATDEGRPGDSDRSEPAAAAVGQTGAVGEPSTVRETSRDPQGKSRARFALLPQPQLGRLHRTTLRSAIGLGVGAFLVSYTGHHNEVWVLMTLIALIPPALPLTIDRVLQRLVGTVVAMLVLTVIAAVIPPGPLRLLALMPGIVLMVAYIKRSYAISVLGVTLVAVLGYAQVEAPLQEALLWRGFDTLIGAVIAITLTLLIPVGARPKPVWAPRTPSGSSDLR